MKKYVKPIIEEENIEIEDIIATSMNEPQDSYSGDNDIIEV